MNLQIQQVSKITLQNRLALDTLLLKEQGVCGLLNLTDGECYLTIHNAITPLEEAGKKMRVVSEQTWELFQARQPKDGFGGWSPRSWFMSLLNSQGLTRWGKWLLNIVVMLGCGFLLLMIGLAIVKRTISQLLSSLSSLSVMWKSTLDEDYIDNVWATGWCGGLEELTSQTLQWGKPCRATMNCRWEAGQQQNTEVVLPLSFPRPPSSKRPDHQPLHFPSSDCFCRK